MTSGHASRDGAGVATIYGQGDAGRLFGFEVIKENLDLVITDVVCAIFLRSIVRRNQALVQSVQLITDLGIPAMLIIVKNLAAMSGVVKINHIAPSPHR